MNEKNPRGSLKGFAMGSAKAVWRGTNKASKAVLRVASGGSQPKLQGSDSSHSVAGTMDLEDDDDDIVDVVDLTDFSADDEVPLHSPQMDLLLPTDSAYCTHFDNNVRRALYYLHLESLPKRHSWDQLRQTIAMALTVLYSQDEKEQLLRIVVEHMDSSVVLYVVGYLHGRLARVVLHELMSGTQETQQAFANYLSQQGEHATNQELEEFWMHCCLWREYFFHKYRMAMCKLTLSQRLLGLQQVYQEYLVMGLELPDVQELLNGQIEVYSQHERMIHSYTSSASFSNSKSPKNTSTLLLPPPLPLNTGKLAGMAPKNHILLPDTPGFDIQKDKSAMQLLVYSIVTQPEQVSNPPPSPSVGTPHNIRQTFGIKPSRFVTRVLQYHSTTENWPEVRKVIKDYLYSSKPVLGAKQEKGCAGLIAEPLLTVDTCLEVVLQHGGPASLSVELLDSIRDPDRKFSISFQNGLIGPAIQMATELGDRSRLKKMRAYLERIDDGSQEISTYLTIINNLLENKQMEWKQTQVKRMLLGVKKGMGASVGILTLGLTTGSSTNI